MTDQTRSIHIQTPLKEEVVTDLRVGDRVLLSGIIYTARDAAHQRLVAALQQGREVPIPIAGQCLYYVGPSPIRPGQIIGSAGPTTASRVDPYTPALLEQGLTGMIGKGKRNQIVRDALITYQAGLLRDGWWSGGLDSPADKIGRGCGLPGSRN